MDEMCCVDAVYSTVCFWAEVVWVCEYVVDPSRSLVTRACVVRFVGVYVWNN